MNTTVQKWLDFETPRPFRHLSKHFLTLPLSEGFSIDQVIQLIPDEPVRVVCSYPKRHFPHPETVIDIYAHRKPEDIGYLTLHYTGQVNENNCAVLDAVLHYTAGDKVNDEIMERLDLLVESVDAIRGDRTSGRVLTAITRAKLTVRDMVI